MLTPMQHAFMQPNDKIAGAISQGMQWIDKAIYNHAQQSLPVMDDDKQAVIWHSIKNNPMALQSYIFHLGSKQGITDHAGLDKLAGDYIRAQSAKFGG